MRTRLSALLGHPWFEPAIMILIAINAITLGLETSDWAMANFGGFLVALDTTILAIFVVEIATRLIANFTGFWRDPWRIFDFAIVSIALVPASGPLSILRAFRILRVLRLISGG